MTSTMMPCSKRVPRAPRSQVHCSQVALAFFVGQRRYCLAHSARCWPFQTCAKKRTSRPINVGRHRVQRAIQYLPAIKGGLRREYKISLIHLRTHMKYSEIHPSMRSKRVSEVLQRAVKRLPPFHLVVTDNAMSFTLAYSAHPERKTAFERTVDISDCAIWRIAKCAPWQTRLSNVPIEPIMTSAFQFSSSPARKNGDTFIVYTKCTTTPSDRSRA